MIGWIIASPFLLLAALIGILLLCRVHLTVRFRSDQADGSGSLELSAGIGIIRLRIFPRPQKKLRIRDYTRSAIKKKEEKKRRAAQKKAAAAKKKPAGAPKKAATDAKSPPKRHQLLPMLRYLTRAAGILLRKFNSALQIEVRRFVITAGTEDAARTAILYGLLCQAGSALFAVLEHFCNLRYSRDAAVGIDCDFLSGRTSADLHLTFSICVWQLVSIGWSALLLYLRKDKNT